MTKVPHWQVQEELFVVVRNFQFETISNNDEHHPAPLWRLVSCDFSSVYNSVDLADLKLLTLLLSLIVLQCGLTYKLNPINFL